MVLLYVCHYCVEYNTSSLSDMIKHFKRKTKCKCSTINSYEESKILSKNKYEFTFDTSNLTKNEYLYIITHYSEKYNTIHKNFKEIFEQKFNNNQNTNQIINQNTNQIINQNQNISSIYLNRKK